MTPIQLDQMGSRYKPSVLGLPSKMKTMVHLSPYPCRDLQSPQIGYIFHFTSHILILQRRMAVVTDFYFRGRLVLLFGAGF